MTIDIYAGPFQQIFEKHPELTNSKEKTGYPTQKPVALIKRFVQASSPPGGLVVDFFASSGVTGAACKETGRNCVLVDSNPQAIKIMRERLL